MSNRALGFAIFCLLIPACARSSSPKSTESQGELTPAAGIAAPRVRSAAPSPKAPAAPPTREAAHRLVTDTLACWLGSLWSETDAASEEQRAADADRHCRELVQSVYGADDRSHYERLRAVEPVEIAELGNALHSVAQTDAVDAPRHDELATLLDVYANAMHETLYARRAAERVKLDVAGRREAGKLTIDEAVAVPDLSESKAFEALFDLPTGPFRAEARVVALLVALDRMKIADGLAKPLKVYAMEGPNRISFGVNPPPMPGGSRAALGAGAWLSYLSEAARLAGHAVPARAITAPERERLAWNGVIAGYADKLRVEIPGLSDATALKRVAQATVRRLGMQSRDNEAAIKK